MLLLLSCQCHLDQQGTSDLVVDLIISNHSSRIFQEAIDLAIALLDGGNSVIQVFTQVYILHWNSLLHSISLHAPSFTVFISYYFYPGIGFYVHSQLLFNRGCNAKGYFTFLLFVMIQKSFYVRLTVDKKSEVFFKVLYDHIREAQQEIKATVSVNTADSLASKLPEDGLSTDSKKKEKRKFHHRLLQFRKEFRIFNLNQLSTL